MKGIVEEIGLCMIKICGVDGEFYFFVNSNIIKVVNYMFGEIFEVYKFE